MTIFYFPQFEKRIFWQYLSRLNDFRAPCIDHCFEKWKICQMIIVGLDEEYWVHVRTRYLGGLGCLFTNTPNEIWDFLEYLAHDTWEYNNAKETFSHTILDPYMMHSISLDESQFGGNIF